MKLLILGGMHGNERLGVDLVRSLQEQPIRGVDSFIANPRAVEQNARYVESDLNRSFGRQNEATYETRRALLLQNITAKYDVVLDFHNTQTPNNNCCFVGERCEERLYNVAKQLRFSRCIEATYDCVNKYCPNTISIEISVNDKLDSVEYWRKAIQLLMAESYSAKNATLDIYRFLKRVTHNEQQAFDLSRWEPFRPLSKTDKKLLNVEGEVVPIFIGSRLTEFYATLINKTGEK